MQPVWPGCDVAYGCVDAGPYYVGNPQVSREPRRPAEKVVVVLRVGFLVVSLAWRYVIDYIVRIVFVVVAVVVVIRDSTGW